MTTEKYEDKNGEKKSMCEKLVLVMIELLRKEKIDDNDCKKIESVMYRIHL